MPRHRLSEAEKEAGLAFYLVELTWNDGTRTVFVVRAHTAGYALNATEVKALNMWDGYIVSNHVETIPIPDAPNLPEHIYTDHSGYHEE